MLDATPTFDRRDIEGNIIVADEIARVTAANLSNEFAVVTLAADVLDVSAERSVRMAAESS